MINKSIRVFLTKNLNINPYEACGELHDYIVTEAHEYMAFKREIVLLENVVYQGFELKARSLKDVLNGQLFYYCPCRCGFVYDTNLVPYRPIAVEYIPQPGQVESQDFELKQYFLDIQRQRHGHQPQLLQQLMEQPHQFMMQYQNYISQHHEGFLHLRTPQELGRPYQYFKATAVKIGAQHPQVVEPLQNLDASIDQQLAADEEEVDVETEEDEVEEQEHIVVDDEQEQLEVSADDEEEEEDEVEEEREEEVEEKEHIVVVDQKEEEEEEQRVVVADEEEEVAEVEEDFEEDEEQEHMVSTEKDDEAEQGHMVPPPPEEQQRVDNNEEEEEEEEEEQQEHIVDEDDKEEEFEEEEHERMDISDEEEEEELDDEEEHEHMEIYDGEEIREHIAPPPFQEQQQDVAEEVDGEEIEEEEEEEEIEDEEEQQHVLSPQLQVKPIQCYAISSTSSDDSDEEAIFMEDGFPPAVHDWDVIQSPKISSTTKVEGDESDYIDSESDEIDWSTDSADEDYY